MEVVQRTDDGPFGRRDVEEWSRLDELTGMLEHARVQTDRWAGVDARGGSHKYGKKVVDATKTGDAGHHRQRQQLEVFQSRVPGGALQVIRTQSASSWSSQQQQGPSRLAASTTVSSSSTSSRSRWSSRSAAGGSTVQDASRSLEPAENFANLELALNPIDVSSLKMKACVGRSGSIGGRRPPSSRSRRLSVSSAVAEEDSAPSHQLVVEEPSVHLSELSRLCQQVHEEQKLRFSMGDDEEFKFGPALGRRLSKSSSTDDIPAESVARDEQDEGMSSWRRGARVRRSLQFSPRDSDRASSACMPVPATKRHSFITVESLKEVRGRLRHLTSDQVERSGKKNGVLKIPDYRRHDDEQDDGIASEETAAESDSPVNTLRGTSKPYAERPAPSATSPSSAAPQTGSLESRSSRASAAARSDEWFNRRKSYGFEQVHGQASERGGSITEGKKTDSADSGISRSTETVPMHTATAPWNETVNSSKCIEENEEQRRKKTVITLNAMSSANKWQGHESNTENGISPTRRRFSESTAFFRSVTAEAQAAARRANAAPKPTTITIPIVFQQQHESEQGGERKKFSLRQLPDSNRAFTNGHSDTSSPDPETLGWASRRQLDGLGPAKRRSWAGDSSLLSQENHTTNYYSDCEEKNSRFNTTNSIISQEIVSNGDVDTDDALSTTTHKKTKRRVEFCKTEVHFAAESGRFHIIETDEKPPPSNNFRRRRRSQPSSSSTNAAATAVVAPVVAQKPPLPELRFGDSMYEKKMLMASTTTTPAASDTPVEPKEVTVPIVVEGSGEKGVEEHIYTIPNTIVSAELSSEDSGRHTDSDDSRPRGIFRRMDLDELENKLSADQEESRVWGVRLRPVGRVEPLPSPPTTTTTSVAAPVWRSTVTLRNPVQDEQAVSPSSVTSSSPGQMELQKLLRSLRPAAPQRRSLDLSVITDTMRVTTAQEPILPTWSVAERIRQHEDRKSRGFSTKINLGGSGETTVLQNSESVWLGSSEENSASPTRHDSVDVTSETGGHINSSRPLVVRIGNNHMKKDEEFNTSTATATSSLNNGYSSVSSTDSTRTKTTSISIDQSGNLSPKYRPEAVRRASTGVLKSPSLIMQTFGHSFSPARVRDLEEPRVSLPELGVPGQLAALRQLYEAAGEDDDSDAADREVSALMSPEDPTPPQRSAKSVVSSSPCGGSVVSGSWSKMRAVRLSQQFHKYQPPTNEVKPSQDVAPVPASSGFVRLKQPAEASGFLLRPVPRACRRAATTFTKQETDIPRNIDTTREDTHNVSSKQAGSYSEVINQPMQVTAATFSVPSYCGTEATEQGRLRSVDTLVSTRSGAPRITSISLRYEGEADTSASSSPPTNKSVTAISGRRASSPIKLSSPSNWGVSENRTSPSKSITSFPSPKRSISPSSAKTVTSISSRLSASPAKQAQDLTASHESRNSPTTKSSVTSLTTASTKSVASSNKISTGLPPHGSSPMRRSISPAGPRAPLVKGPITAPTRRVPSPNQTPPKKTTPQQTYFGAEVLEVEPRPEDRRGEDEMIASRPKTEQIREVRRSVASHRSTSRGRLSDYTTETAKVRLDTSANESCRARSLSPMKRLNTLVTGDPPIYQNQAAISVSKLSPPPEPPVTSSAALIEELTRAADEILQAVNGYSDDSPASSDDEKPVPRLSSLREGEVSRTEERTPRKKVTTAASRLKKKATSSTSSVESVSKEPRIPQRPALPGVRSGTVLSSAARPTTIPGSPSQQRASSSDEGGSGRKQRVLRRRPVVAANVKPELTKEEEEASKARERSEARNERLRTSRPRRPRSSPRAAEESSPAATKRVLAPDLSKHRAPVERIIPAAPRKSPAKTRRDEHHQFIRTANGATAERRLLLLESGSGNNTRGCGGTTTSSGLGGRLKARGGDPLKLAAAK